MVVFFLKKGNSRQMTTIKNLLLNFFKWDGCSVQYVQGGIKNNKIHIDHSLSRSKSGHVATAHVHKQKRWYKSEA